MYDPDTIGVAAFTDAADRDRHRICASTLPVAGSSTASPVRVKNTARGCPPIGATTGEEYPASSLSACHAVFPVFPSKATIPPPFAPPTPTSTRPSNTTGEHAAPKYPFGAPNSFIAARCHTRLPVPASNAVNVPSAPDV